MRIWEMAFLCIAAAIGGVGFVLWLKHSVGTPSLRTGKQRVSGFSVFDMQLSIGGGAERPKREAALYLTLKSSPVEPNLAAKLLFEQKVRRLGE